MDASAPDRRSEVLQTGYRLAQEIFGQVGAPGIGGTAEMATPWGKVILGSYGYLGAFVEHEGTLYAFGTGSRSCQDAFQRNHAGGAARIVRLHNTMFLGSGDDSAVIAKIEELDLPRHALDMLDGRTQPEAGVVSLPPSDDAWNLQKWGLGRIEAREGIGWPYRYREPDVALGPSPGR